MRALTLGCWLAACSTAAAWAEEPVDAAHPSLPAAATATDSLQGQALLAWQQAQQALQHQDWVQAELWLERVLMLAPHHAEALLELVRVMIQRGRVDEARALLQVLLDDPRTPPLYRQRLQSLAVALAQPLPAAAPDKAWVGQAGLAYGYHSNPLALTSATKITLTTPQGELTLPLARRPQGSATLQGEWIARSPSGHEWLAQVMRVAAPASEPAWRVAGFWPLGAGADQSGVGIQLAAQQALDGTQRLQALALCTRGCWTAGDRSIPAALALGAYRETATGRQGLLMRLSMQVTPQARPAPNQPPAIDGQIWADWELAARPQPDIVRVGAAVVWQPLRTLQLQAAVQIHNDVQGYSPLLAGGAPRRILTADVQAHWALWVSASGLASLGLRAGYTQRWANIDLWAWRGRYLQLQWQQAWR